LAGVVVAEPSFVYIGSVWTIQKIFQARFHVGLKPCAHTERRPTPLADVRELEWGSLGYVFSHVDPDIAILFLRWIGTDSVPRKFRAFAQGWNVHATALPVIAPPMVRTFHTTVRDPARGKRGVAMRATVFQCSCPAFIVPKQDDRLAQDH
jgi:hypothetical protein